ncbi:MAG: bifunctional 3-(3-hydroxy-phenyl)propionate/3-hydroxycinnamic acid hydroxylase [Ktedonobacteraceae bacterium]
MEDEAQVVIVGAGPTGLMAANLLGQAGIHALLIERHAGLSDEARAITIDDEGLRICQAVGLADEIGRQACLNVQANYVSHKRLLAHVAPQQQPNGYPLISTFYQPSFEATLLRGARRFPNITASFGHTVETIQQDAHGVILTVSTPDGARRQVRCAYVLACDGGRSGLRQAAGIRLRPPRLRDLFYAPETDSGQAARSQRMMSQRSKERATQRWLIVEYPATNGRDSSGQIGQSKRITFYCNPARPAVSVQAPPDRQRWEFMLKPGEQDADLFDIETIEAMIAQAEATLPPALATRSHNERGPIDRKVVYTFYATIATAFSCGRIFLLGDAAHLMPPFGGQGMNSGLRDAYNLCWKLKLVIQGQASEHLLTSYQQERHTHVARMIVFSSLLGQIIMPTNPILAWGRNMLLRGIGRVSFLRAQLTEMRVRPQPRYTRGFLLPDPHTKLAGRLLPQPLVIQNGARVRLDEVLGPHFTLLRLSEDPPEEAFNEINSEEWTHLQLHFVCIRPRLATRTRGTQEARRAFRDSSSAAEAEKGASVVEDCEGVLAAFLHNRRDIFVLVRPDQYILGAFQVKQVREMKRTETLFSEMGLDKVLFLY